MQSDELLTENELKAAEFRALFDLVLDGLIKLEQIPQEHRLTYRNVYIAAFRHARGGWAHGEFSETETVLGIMKNDIQHMNPGNYRKWLENRYEERKMAFRIFRSERKG
jgi:23S rRNA U2552 (ribose-2'-O)-methylase RlmE/FtsJ